MKIAMINTPFLTRTGGERQILMLALELQKRGHQIEIFTSFVEKTTYPELFSKIKINVIPIEPKFPKLLNKASVLSMIMLSRKITKDFDIINNHNFPTEWAAFLAKNRLKIPVVWMCNEPPFWHLHPQQRVGIAKLGWPLYKIFDKMAVKQIDEILALSYLGANTIRQVYNRESRIVRSGVNVELCHNATGKSFRKKHGLANDIVLLQIGTFVYYKRQEDSITALALLSKKHENVKLVLDGYGNPKHLTSLAQKLGVEDKIIFTHATSDEELASTYAACDVFLYPSDNTWGLVVAEAMAASKPIIVSKNSGAAEIITDNVTGFKVNHKKPTEIADHVEYLINNPELIEEMGNNSYQYVKQNLSWEKYAKDIEKIFYHSIQNSGKQKN
jgi:glycosyltransferase involved in cell wall biosynthesis